MRASFILAVALTTTAAAAQTGAPPMAGMRPGAGTSFVPAGPAVALYNEAMTKMMADMGKPYTGDADADFVSHMIGHHQGAIDMAEIELKYGSDPKIKQLAARIISAQQREIAVMQAWAARHPAKAGPAPADPHMQVK